MPPASGEPVAGIPDPGSSAGSNAAADTGNNILYASKSAREVAALSNGGSTLWNKGGGSGYLEESPRKLYFRKDSPGRMCQRSPRTFDETGNRPEPTSLSSSEGARRKKEVGFKTVNATNSENLSKKELKKKREEKETKKETVLEVNAGRIRRTKTV